MAEAIGEDYTQPQTTSPISNSDPRAVPALSIRQDTTTRYSTTPERTLSTSDCTRQDTASTYPTPPHQTTPSIFDSCDVQEDVRTKQRTSTSDSPYFQHVRRRTGGYILLPQQSSISDAQYFRPQLRSTRGDILPQPPTTNQPPKKQIRSSIKL